MRLFVALRPPPAVRMALRAMMSGVPDARWQTDAQLHLTLAFIGEADRHQADDIATALGAVRQPGFDARLGEFGSFENGRGRVQALWIGAGPEARLAPLAASVSRALVPAGVPLPTRRFLPHITLARFPARGIAPSALERFLTHQRPPALAWPVTEMHLMESRLGREGAHHESRMQVPLTGSSADPRPR